MPAISFKAAIEKLKMTNAKAFFCFKKFHDEFKGETKVLKYYATRKLLDEIWETKVRNFETKGRVRPDPDQSHHYHQEEAINLNFGDHSFLELRDDQLRRCYLMQNVRAPNLAIVNPEDQERKNSADSFVKKVNASIRDLIPNLQKCGKSASAMKAALQEMDVIAKFLETYHHAWEGEGAMRQEYDQEDDNEDK